MRYTIVKEKFSTTEVIVRQTDWRPPRGFGGSAVVRQRSLAEIRHVVWRKFTQKHRRWITISVVLWNFCGSVVLGVAADGDQVEGGGGDP